ncbi:MAG TPA: type II secretion system F family protein, partial [Bryobacteraceae bacterium]|nr:type II secretion system F family protein [Bryobacteraceae bacterium]
MAATWHFRAVAPDGKVRAGTVQADTEKAVAQELRKQGLTPVYVGAGTQRGVRFELPSFGRGRRRDVLYFTQELSTLLSAGIPLDRALSITAELTERVAFRSVVSDVIRVLKGGKSLADSLATRPEYFSELYINMVRAGEASGSLAGVFERLAEFERTRDDLRNYIISSMVYPGLLITVGLVSVVFLLTFVVPRFASVFEESRLQMPTPTRVMLQASNALTTYGWLAAALTTGLIVALSMAIRTPGGRLWWDSFRLRTPVLGIALRKAE